MLWVMWYWATIFIDLHSQNAVLGLFLFLFLASRSAAFAFYLTDLCNLEPLSHCSANSIVLVNDF